MCIFVENSILYCSILYYKKRVSRLGELTKDQFVKIRLLFVQYRLVSNLLYCSPMHQLFKSPNAFSKIV